jgi:hypothetical protein
MERFRIDFVAVGPQRTGTSWLDQMLRRHPSVCLPRQVKETMFFEQHWDKGAAWYAAHFPACGEGALRGEVAPTCFDVPAAVDRIAELNPECRIIVTLREPVSRTVSLWQHHVAKGRAPRDFSSAVRDMPRILDSGRYALHVPRWQGRFGAARVLILLIDDIEERPQAVLDTVTEFLGLPPQLVEEATDRVGAVTMPRFPRLASLAARTATALRARRLHWIPELGKRLGLRRVFTGADDRLPRLSRGETRTLQETFAPDVAYVEQLLGRPLTRWHHADFTAATGAD